jgi:succinate-acetate transporter protein
MEINEEKNRNNLFLNDNTANPAPLGLFAFGMTTHGMEKAQYLWMVTFGSFGFFWISFATLLLLPVLDLAKASQPVELAAFLRVRGIVAVGLFISTVKNAQGTANYLTGSNTAGSTPGDSKPFRQHPDPEPPGVLSVLQRGSCTLH